MKRSQINKALKELEAMCEKHSFYLPFLLHDHGGVGKRRA